MKNLVPQFHSSTVTSTKSTGASTSKSQFFIFQNFIEKLINSELKDTFLKHKFFCIIPTLIRNT